MKTYPFIVINKDNMKELRHYATAGHVAAYLLGRKLDNIMVIINEYRIVHIGDLGTSDVHKIERLLNEVSAALA